MKQFLKVMYLFLIKTRATTEITSSPECLFQIHVMFVPHDLNQVRVMIQKRTF